MNGAEQAAAPGDVARVAAAMSGADVVELIPLECCSPAPYNPRKFGAKPSAALIQLALSIRRTGQVQPATVRRQGDGYEIVCGERRWRACCLCTLAEVADAQINGGIQPGPGPALAGEAAEQLATAGPPPRHLRAIVRELTDEQAMEICTVENLEREDLQPLEEAAGVETLLRLYRGDVEAVASRLRRPVSWVAARVRLTTLSPNWRKAIASEERGFETWTAAHLAEVAKLEPKAQDELLRRFHHPADASVKDVRASVGASLRTLGLAPFDIEDAALQPKCGACTTCKTTSASTPGLFADEGDEIRPSELRKARCLNPGCWDDKVVAHARAKVRELRKQHGDAAIVADHDSYRLPQDLQQKARRIGNYSEFSNVKEGTKGAWPGVYAVGEKAGQVEWFTKRAKESGRAKRRSGKAGGAGAPPVTALKDRRIALDRRRKVLAVGKIAEAVKKSTVTPTSDDLLAVAIAFGTQTKADSLSTYYFGGNANIGDRWSAFDAAAAILAGKGGAAQLEKALAGFWAAQLRPVLLSRLNYQGSHTDIAKLWTDAQRTAELAGVDAAAHLAKAVEEIPEPKSWEALARQEKEARKAAKVKPAVGSKTGSAAKAKSTRKAKRAAAAEASP